MGCNSKMLFQRILVIVVLGLGSRYGSSSNSASDPSLDPSSDPEPGPGSVPGTGASSGLGLDPGSGSGSMSGSGSTTMASTSTSKREELESKMKESDSQKKPSVQKKKIKECDSQKKPSLQEGKINGLDHQNPNSLQEAADWMEEREQRDENELRPEGRNENLFEVHIEFEDLVLRYGQHHLNESSPLIDIVNSVLDLRIQRVFSRNASDFHLEGSGKQNFIRIPSDNFHNNGTVLVGIIYRNLHEERNSTKNNRTVIMAATMDPKPKQLQQNIVLNFRNPKAGDGERFCAFWNGSNETYPDGWSKEGCHVVRSKSSSGQTQCSCNHMTHFAVLVDYGGNTEITEADEKILTILTYVGLSLSIAGLILTIIAYAGFTNVHQPLSQIRMSLSGSLGVAQVLFLCGINFTKSKVACVTLAALMQYFLMVAFCWMLVEGIYLYLLVVKVYNINNKMTMYYVMSWGFPAAMVAVSLSIAAAKGGIKSFVSDDYCWMSPDSEVIWIFVGFLVMIEIISLLLLLRVTWEITTMQPKGKHRTQEIRVGIKACLMLIPLLGVTWLFGLLSPFHKAFVYIFTILNSTQGFLIFLLHCIRLNQIKDRFKKKMNAFFFSSRIR